MSQALNYRHLYYFWVVTKEGGISRAAARLDMAVQTVSTQVRELERAIGLPLLKPAGRGLLLTEAGRVAMRQADQIFQLGEQLPELVRASAGERPSMRLAVGVPDGLPKLVVHNLMTPLLDEPKLRLVCHVGEFNDLLADLALHRLDVMLSDRPPPTSANLKVYSHRLAAATLSWYAPPAWQAAARKGFPRSLEVVPVLLPTPHGVVRGLIDQWFEREGVRPRIAGEFEDSALLKTFGAGGMGVFPAVDLVHDELVSRYGVRRVGRCEGVEERFFAVGTEKRVSHPLVARLLPHRSVT